MMSFGSIVSSLILLLPSVSAEVPDQAVRLDWAGVPDRVWAGEHCWANRLQDWRVRDERLELTFEEGVRGARTVHLLTRQLSEHNEAFTMSVRSGLTEGDMGRGSAIGFIVGAGRGELDPRGAAIVQWAGEGAGYFAGVDDRGSAFIHRYDKPLASNEALEELDLPTAWKLQLSGKPAGSDYVLELIVRNSASDEVLSRAELTVPADEAVGNVALAVEPGKPVARCWFDDWETSGAKFVDNTDNSLGPVMSYQYTLHGGVLKLTAQLMPVGGDPDALVMLQRRADAGWEAMATAEVTTPGYTATFKVPDWNDTRDHDVRVVYNGSSFDGTIRSQPEGDTLVLGVVNCMHQNSHRLVGGDWGGGTATVHSWLEGLWFPHNDLVKNLSHHNPDVLFFAGDQLYEGGSPTKQDWENLELDYLYKWYLFCWTFRDMMRDRPAVTIPDDHDIYQGNLWGAEGRHAKRDEDGGYLHPAWFVKMVERTQTSHLPDPYDPTPVRQGIGVYYTAMNYGGVGFAILEDRKFKSGPRANRSDRYVDMNDPTLQLLGKRQLDFLEHWAGDWKDQDIKAVLSQTVFAQANTHTSSDLNRIKNDFDTNGFPVPGRNRAVAAIRKAFAVHICGDQHLSTLLKHGIDDHGDAMWSFCGPSAANFWPRAWAPMAEGSYVEPADDSQYLGNFTDGFNNRITMYAAANPTEEPTGLKPADLYDRVPGYGIVRFHRENQQITFESWPRHVEPTDDSLQYPNWPRTVDLADNYAKKPVGFLPEVRVVGSDEAVIRIYQDEDALVYARRLRGDTFRPAVFSDGTYTVEVGVPADDKWERVTGVSIADGPDAGPLIFDLAR